MINQKDIAEALGRLGVKRGDTCVFHSSYKSLGPVEGGAAAVIQGFEAALGAEGTLVAPTLCSKDFFECYNNWHLNKPSEVGYLTEFFRQQAGVLRSDQATHSVAARGRLAYDLTHEHTAYGPHLCPFGEYAFADSSPWMKMHRQNAKVVFVGVSMKYHTMKHMVESAFAEHLLAQMPDPALRAAQKAKLQTFKNRWEGVWLYYNGEAMQQYLEEQGLVAKNRCGEATLLCISAKEANDAALQALIRAPERWYKDASLQWIQDCKKTV
ncbi:MAG: AAC(3) family N-acetyltransferase [Clostridia bacterium]|nr:AAC(3) family N-acetyltransferase [Clostridia bacterium]